MAMRFDFTIPPGFPFSLIGLKQGADGGIELDWRPVAAVCIASGIDPDVISSSVPAICLPMLLEGWLTVQTEAGMIAPEERDEARRLIAIMGQQARQAGEEDGSAGACEVRVTLLPKSALH